MENEIWKDIPDYPGYQVSNLGRVRTHNKTTYTKKHGTRHWKDRILKLKMQNRENGRKDYRVELWNNGKHKTMLVARLVAFTFFEKDFNDKSLTVNHIDCNSLNNNINNLELVSILDNVRHAFENDLYPQKHTKIINKQTLEEHTFLSMSKASIFINKNDKYIADSIRRNKFENKEYKWELI